MLMIKKICNYNIDLLLILVTIVLSLTTFFMDRNLGLPSVIKILVDISTTLILIRIVYKIIKREKKIGLPMKLVIAFGIVSFVSYLLNGYFIVNYIVKLEFDYLRFFIVYLGVIYLDISKEDIKNIFKYLNIFILIQIPIIIVQYFIIKDNFISGENGIMQDYLSGLLGGKSTGELGGYICIAIVAYYVLFRYNKMNIKTMLGLSVALLFIVIFSEIKVVLLILPILAMCTYINGTGKKHVILICVAIGLLFSGVYFTGKIYPEFKDLLTVSKMKEYLNFQYAESNLSRFDSIGVANDTINDSIDTALVGVGIGNVESDSPKASEFAKDNIYIFKMFTWSLILVETGYIGIALMIAIFGLSMYYSVELMRKSKCEFNKIIGTIGIPTIILYVILNFYGMSMTKYNFGILAWMSLGLITKLYYDEFNIEN